MLIRCGKCGKMYDYDKCNGICPKCSRYNRPDSREDMEQSLHDKYDAEANPRQHDWYRAGAGDAGRRIAIRLIKSRSVIRMTVETGEQKHTKKAKHRWQ